MGAMVLQIIYFIFLTLLIVIIAKYVLVKLLRKLAETLNLKPKTVGNISGIATSVPELLTVSFSAASGLITTGIANILSSNIINFILYGISVLANKNTKLLKNKAIKIDIFLVMMTIIIPIAMVIFHIESNITVVPIFLLLFIFFYFINNNAHKLYLTKVDQQMEEKILEEEKWLKGKKKKSIIYTILLFGTAILLFIVGNALSDVLEKLCIEFNIPEIIIGILLGFITSIPELITFFEAQKQNKKQNREKEGIVEATNNLLSSNLLNLFMIQSIGIIIYVLLYS